jgi:cytochrome P450
MTSVDPLSPSPPQTPFFDSALDAWALSRYADVMAAFRDPLLAPVGPRSKGPPKDGHTTKQAYIRSETLAALCASQIAIWQAEIEPVANHIFEQLPRERPIDLVSDLALPWSLEVALIVTRADSHDGERLAHLAAQVSASAADPFDSALQSQAAAASSELERLLTGGAIPMRAPTFVALSQTLPAFLANAWLALLRHPAELAQLRDQPYLMPRAMNELLRYAGLARMIFRRAMANVEIGSVKIAEGERIVLMLASANRDAAQFSEADRLDLTRQAVGQLALGAGAHSCVGAALIRMAASVATAAFASRFSEAVVCGPIDWCGGLGFRSPASLTVAIP